MNLALGYVTLKVRVIILCSFLLVLASYLFTALLVLWCHNWFLLIFKTAFLIIFYSTDFELPCPQIPEIEHIRNKLRKIKTNLLFETWSIDTFLVTKFMLYFQVPSDLGGFSIAVAYWLTWIQWLTHTCYGGIQESV